MAVSCLYFASFQMYDHCSVIAVLERSRKTVESLLCRCIIYLTRSLIFLWWMLATLDLQQVPVVYPELQGSNLIIEFLFMSIWSLAT